MPVRTSRWLLVLSGGLLLAIGHNAGGLGWVFAAMIACVNLVVFGVLLERYR